MAFNAEEIAILAAVQGDIPDSLTPFADIAKKVGASEKEVIELLNALKSDGTIRRFGATLRHQKTGWNANAMVAWVATPAEAEKFGPIAARHPRVSHAYYRPSSAEDWPYTLYTMIHGRSDAECQETAAELKAAWPLKNFAFLKSLREFKKTSMRYFAKE